jgi:hypothetical protein
MGKLVLSDMAEVRLKTGEIVLIDDDDLPKVAHVEAALAYNDAAAMEFGKFAKLNSIT